MGPVRKGRIVIYTFGKARRDRMTHQFFEPEGQSDSVPAIVVEARTDTMVNLRVFQDGNHRPIWATSVDHKSVAHPDMAYWEWPAEHYGDNEP